MGSNKKKAPAFQFYPGDFLNDQHVQIMTLAERGAYITLLCSAWGAGSIPDNRELQARICGVSIDEMQQLWSAIEPCWRVKSKKDNTRLVNNQLEVARKRQTKYRKEQRKKAIEGWRKRKEDNKDTCRGNATGKQRQCPSSSPSSPNDTDKLGNRSEQQSNGDAKPTDDDISNTGEYELIPRMRLKDKLPLLDAEEIFWQWQEKFGLPENEKGKLLKAIRAYPKAASNEAEAALQDKIDSGKPPDNYAAYLTKCIKYELKVRAG